MDALLSKLTRFILSGAIKLLILSLIVGLVIIAYLIGFATDFGNCFGKPSCTNNAGMYMILFPAVVIFGSVILLYRWRISQRKNYKQSVKNEVLSEIGYVNKSIGIQLETAIIDLLQKHGELSLDDIVIRTNTDNDTVLTCIRQLMQSQKVKQRLEANSAYFSIRNI